MLRGQIAIITVLLARSLLIYLRAIAINFCNILNETKKENEKERGKVTISFQAIVHNKGACR